LPQRLGSAAVRESGHFHLIIDEAISIHRGGTHHVEQELAKLNPLERALYGVVTEAIVTDGIVMDQQRHLFISVVVEIENLAYHH
jgi:hypothetical protein